VATRGEEILGTHTERGFPLLVKLLDAAATLSVQLHPGEESAREIEGEGARGKSEVWIVLEAGPGSRVVHGLAASVEPERFFTRMEALRGERLPVDEEAQWLRWVEVREGDVVFVPAGTVHALGEGLVVVEFQESSDLTYRIHDWGRRDAAGRLRDLHFEKARRVPMASPLPCPVANVFDLARSRGERLLTVCEGLSLRLLSLGAGESRCRSTREGSRRAPEVLCVLVGDLGVQPRGAEPSRLAALDFGLLPASVGDYEVSAGAAGAVCVAARPGTEAKAPSLK
jgi:mannose-6-phosphate isomerase